jgi:hypothetical protein
MRVTVSHNQPKQEVIQRIDRGLDDIFKGATGGMVQITDEQRSWVDNQLNFSFNARAGFVNIPVKGLVIVDDHLVTIDVDLPSFVNNLFPEQKMASGIETRVRGLLT